MSYFVLRKVDIITVLYDTKKGTSHKGLQDSDYPYDSLRVVLLQGSLPEPPNDNVAF